MKNSFGAKLDKMIEKFDILGFLHKINKSNLLQYSEMT